MTRSQVRALYFDHLAGRLGDPHARLTEAAVESLEKLSPALHAELVKAYVKNERSEVDWKREARAIDQLGEMFAWYGVTRRGLRRKDFDEIAKVG